ncbi:hypothetical protein ACOTC5_29795 [Achromobacter xylosoxidans]
MTSAPQTAATALLLKLGTGDQRKTLDEYFGYPVSVTDDFEGVYRVCLTIEGVVMPDVRSSDCGRFRVDPQTEYNLTPEQVQLFDDLQGLLESAVEVAVNAGCLAIQQRLGVDSGDLAGVIFSGDDAKNDFRRAFGQYLLAEFNAAG